MSSWATIYHPAHVNTISQQQQQQQQQHNNHLAQISNSSVLPGISERAANGLNSRYLSAAGTASLAAATVAAANQAPQQQQQTSVANNQLLASQSHQHQHAQQQQANNNLQHQIGQQQLQQQQQQQQQPGQTVGPANGGTLTNQQAGGPQQAQPVVQQQQQQQQQQLQPQAQTSNGSNGQTATTSQPVQYSNLANGQQQQTYYGTPVVSSTFTVNPVNGQIAPINSDFLSSGGGVNQIFAPQTSQFVGQNNPIVPALSGFSQFSVAPQTGQQQVPFNSNLLSTQTYQTRQPLAGTVHQRFTSAGPQSVFLSPFHQQQFLANQRLALGGTFSRRNGQQRNPNSNIFGSSLDDDSNGLFQQQQVGLSTNNLIESQYGANGNANGGADLFATNNNYLSPQLTIAAFNQQHHLPYGQNNEQNILLPQQGGGGISSAILGTQNNGLVGSSSQQQQQFVNNALATHAGASVNSLGQQTHYNNNNLGPSSSEQCVAADGRHGTCYQASECIRRGGTPMGKCAGGLSANGLFANNNGDTGSSHVCCLFDVTCGQFAAERFVYFRNPNYPNTFDQSRMCRAKIGKLDKGVCQFRLDMLRFDVAKPSNGNCSSDMFVVSGQNENYVIPKICGFNDGQHYYVGVDESGVITLHMMMMGYYRRSFEVLITQLPCRSDYAAPAHCLQYYMGTHGTIKSFNYDDEFASVNFANTGGNQQQQQQQQLNYDLQQDGSTAIGTNVAAAPYGIQFGSSSGAGQHLQQRQQFFASSVSSSPSGRYTSVHEQFGGYPNDLDYTMCIRKESGFCSITYQLSKGDQGNLSPFGVGQSTFGDINGTSGGHVGASGGWHSVSTECRDDYLLIGGVRLCSGNGGGGGNSGNNWPNGPAQIGPFYESNFAQQNNSQGNSFQLQQQLQNQQNMLMQQLARVQHQAATANATSYPPSNGVSGANLSGSGINSNGGLFGNGGQQQLANNGNNNLEQQQAAIMQQVLLIQQQLNALTSNQGYTSQQHIVNTNRFQHSDINYSDAQGTIITDTTSGPFLLRFVSNLARNARGFHIDYRQNPCK